MPRGFNSPFNSRGEEDFGYGRWDSVGGKQGCVTTLIYPVLQTNCDAGYVSVVATRDVDHWAKS